jgi:pimeloyl-ACP methyl ester carboxylesterase
MSPGPSCASGAHSSPPGPARTGTVAARTASRLEVEADSSGVRLAGTLWRPAGDVVAGVLMHPGSGPSDRDNDWFFPPIREHLLEAGIAVCSFDKRGVGSSAGSWLDAGIPEQADDLLAGLVVFESESARGLPIGLFGHSQGGWVVVEAASRDVTVAFVIPSSGGGASPARQERYSLANKMAEGQKAEALATYDAVMAVIRECPTLDQGTAQLDAEGVPYGELQGLEFMFEDEAIWRLCAHIFAYDPTPALARITAPILGLFGAVDKMNPPEESVDALRAAVRPELLHVEVFPEGDHRLHHGDPPRFVDGYLDRISSFVRGAAGMG